MESGLLPLAVMMGILLMEMAEAVYAPSNQDILELEVHLPLLIAVILFEEMVAVCPLILLAEMTVIQYQAMDVAHHVT